MDPFLGGGGLLLLRFFRVKVILEIWGSSCTFQVFRTRFWKGLADAVFNWKGLTMPPWSIMTLEKSTDCPSSFFQVWENPPATLALARSTSTRTSSAELGGSFSRFTKDRPMRSAVCKQFSQFVVKNPCFSMISGRQTVTEYANHPETPRETRRRALITVEVLWWPNQVR